MALTAAELIAYLRLDKSGFDKGLSDAEGRMRKSDGKFRDWAQGMGRAAVDVTVAGATAAAGLATSVFVTGMNYNTLQQQSRAALETIMDGGEAANAQMDKLDAFAANSPFAKDVFIVAQQQLLGFGLEAEKVVPTLSAVEDAVAAVGGSNEDIRSIVSTLADIQGTGKISGETLRRLGLRGIDAAEIIGDQMGKSGAAIRDEITAGTLDADEAFDALTTGMTEKFGGAAANVKETAVGASDRIRAAFRDIGSHLAEPFIDPHGGGKAIEWANEFADVLRAFQQHVPAFTDMMVDRFGTTFDRISVFFKDTKDAIDDLDVTDVERAIDTMLDYAPAIAGVSGAMLTMTASNIPGLRNFAGALGPIPAAIGAAALASPEMRDALGEVGGALEPLIPLVGDLAGLAAGAFTEGVGLAADVLSLVADILGPVVDGFTSLPDPIQIAVGALGTFFAIRKMAPKFSDSFTTSFTNIRTGISNTVDSFKNWGPRFDGAAGDALRFSSKIGIVTNELGRSAASGIRGALNGVVGALGGPWGIALVGATALLGYWANEQREAKNRVQEFTDTLDNQTAAFTESSDQMILQRIQEQDLAHGRDTLIEQSERFGVSTRDLVGYIKGEEEATKRVTAALDEYEDGQLDHIGVQGAASDKTEEYREVIAGMRGEVEEAVEVKRIEIELERDLQAQLDESERSYGRYIDALSVMSDDTKTAEERTRGLMDALDELNGGQKTSEERARDLATQSRNLADQFENAEVNSDGLRTQLFDLEQGIIAHTDEGNRLNETVGRLSTEAHTAAREAAELAVQEGRAGEAAADAARESQPYIDKIKEIADEFNLTDEELGILLDTMNLVPEEIAFLVTDGETIEATDLELFELYKRIRELPDGETTITDEGTSQDVIDELVDLGAEVTELPEGEVEIDVSGIPEAELEIDAFVNKKRTAKVDFIIGSTPSPAGNYGVPYAPGKAPTTYGGGMGREYSVAPRYFGGIDAFRGMAAGDVTGPSVMDVAQFVKPGDIRYAGDRSDVDEAWIPLDGSNRSIAILNEAIARMPNYDPPGEGMAAGGLTGRLTPPTVEDVEGPDTSELTDTWQEAMDALESSTATTFDQMAAETGSAQQSMSSDVSTAGAVMRSEVTGAQQSMTAEVARAQQVMAADVSRAGSDMSSATTDAQRSMTTETANQLAARTRDSERQSSAMSSDLSANLAAMLADTRSETSSMASTTTTNLGRMADGADREITGMRVESGREFDNMYREGVDAAADLRDGVVDRMGDARSPFAGRVNDLVGVMRDFSKALNDAYGDMGVKVGTPSSISAWTGAILPGYTPGRDVHTFHSPSAGQLNLSGGEGIARPEVVRAMGSSEFMRLNAAARRGGVSAVRSLLNPPSQSFADGGIFEVFGDDAKAIRDEYKPKLPDNWVRPVGATVMDDVVEGLISQLENMMEGADWVRPTEGRVTSPYGSRGGSHHAGMDIAKGHGTPTVSPTFGVVEETGWNLGPGRSGIGALVRHAADMYTYFGHNPVGGLRVRPGDKLGPGDRVGAQGNTGFSTGAHLHWEVQRGPWNDINPHPFWEAAGGGGFGGGSGGGGSDRWASVIRMALRLNSLPTTERYVNAWLRQVQTESGGNPRAVQQIRDINSIRGNHARGLLQVIPPTFAAYSLPGMGDIFNPLHNAAAGMNYAKNRYGVTGMLNAIGRGRGYRAGTLSASPGWHLVGEDGVELVKMGGGETVKNNRQTRQMLDRPAMTQREAEMVGREMAKHMPRGGDLHINNPQVRDVDELADKAATEYRRSTTWLSMTP